MRPTLRALIFLAAAVFAGVAPAGAARAANAGTRFSLSWARLAKAESCISERNLAARVEERLGRRVFDAPGNTDVGIEGYVERRGDGWHATVSITDGTGAVLGTRELESGDASCHDLDAPLVLTIALFIDPNAATAPPPSAVIAPLDAKPVPPTPATPSAPQPQKLTGSPERNHGPEWQSSIAIGAAVVVGLLPAAAPGVTLRSEVRPPHVWPTPIDFSLELAAVTTCPVSISSPRFRFELCAGADAGVLSSEGQANEAVVGHHRFIAAAIARAVGRVNLTPRFFVAVAPSLVVPVVRDSFDYDWNGDRQRVFRPSPAAFLGDLTFGFRVP
jgi:hypothetical protein